ncbi:MAG: ABC transporter ATP-binding protein/permease [Clostridia bacterium]
MIKLNNVNKFYNKKKQNEIHVVNNATLDIPDRGVVAIFGKSGCGKTTLLNVIGGLDKYSGGQITINDELLTRKNTDRIRNEQIGYIFQNYNLDNELSVKDNVAASLKLCGIVDNAIINERVEKALTAVGMEKYINRFPNALSGGQQQRVAIARAIVKSPKIVIADEPTGNLDEQNTVAVMDILREIGKEKLVLLVTHEEKLVEYYCDMVIEVVDGKIEKVEENQELGNYTFDDTNKIYLGELEHKVVTDGNVAFDLYASDDIAQKINIKVVSSNGKIYLQSDDPNIKMVTRANEVKLYEGKKPVKKHENNAQSINFGAPINADPKKVGKLFKTKNSIVEGYKVNFGSGRLGKKMLMTSLFLFTTLIIFVVASFGTVIFQKEAARKELSTKQIAVTIKNQDELDKILSLEGQHGIQSVEIQYARIYGKYHYGNGSYQNIVSANSGLYNFLQRKQTVSMNGVFDSKIMIDSTARIIPQSSKRIGDRKVLAGVAMPQGKNQMVITKCVADEIINNATLDSIKNYQQVVNMSIFPCRIVGVVDGEENFSFIEEKYFVSEFLSGFFHIAPQSTTLYDKPLADNEIVLPFKIFRNHEYKVGDNCTIETEKEKFTFVVKGFLNDKDIGFDKGTLSTAVAPPYDDIITIDRNNAILNDKMAMSFANKYPKVEDDYNFVCAYVYAPNVVSAKAELSRNFALDSINDFDKFIAESIRSINAGSVSLAIVMVATVVIMAVCLYFIMRANTIKRIKQIGVYRAIGVKSKNILFRFWVEGMVIFACTILIAFVIVSSVLGGLGVFGGMVNQIFYYPSWLALVTLLGLVTMTSACSLLPVVAIVRKSPAQILAKYDI